MRIVLKDDISVYQSARRLAFSQNQDVNKQIDEWLEQGIVRPSSSEYASPIVLQSVEKIVEHRDPFKK
ncbi:hypothetical protein TNCV_882361 [Trichonephila clavipes]|nr:hypothetical protein TNCV_882361 [Trichonephila clavipes]